MSPRTATTVTTTTTTAVKLKLSTKRMLLAQLKKHQALYADYKRLKGQIDTINLEVERLRETTGVDSLDLDGFKVTRIKGDRKKLNLQKLVANGCALEWYHDANETKPKKAYTLITCPGEKAHNNEEVD